eukprot:GEMP01085845.1.p1 GENE.GEMP01085845.1~~GEMP01085845.1.p1  ORF type:complete len:209 (+),score=57.67 GEMP01085845.1:177-803(+)
MFRAKQQNSGLHLSCLESDTCRRPMTTTEEWCHLLSKCKMHDCALAKGNRVCLAVVRHAHNVCARNRAQPPTNDVALLSTLRDREPLERHLSAAQGDLQHVTETMERAKKDLTSSEDKLSAGVRQMNGRLALIEGDVEEERSRLHATEQEVREAEARLRETRENTNHVVARLTNVLQNMSKELSDLQARDEIIFKKLAEIESRKKKKP